MQRLPAIPFGRIPPGAGHWGVRIAAVAATVGLLALSAPLIWGAVSAGIGLMSLAALALAGAAVVQALPWAMQLFENWLLGQRKAEARANPVEQLQNEVLRRAERLQDFRKALGVVGGQIESIAEMIEERRHADPSLVLTRQERALDRLVQFHAGSLARLNEAHAALEEFRLKVSQKQAEWEIAVQISITMDKLDPHAYDHLMQEMLADVSFQSIRERFNTVFAEVDTMMTAVDSPARPMLGDRRPDRLGALRLPALHAEENLP